MNPYKENVLITGGAGFIGTHLARTLIAAGHQVVSLDLKSETASPVAGVHYVTGDARNITTVLSLLGQYQITAVYHLAATVSVPLCQKDVIESYSHNFNATLAVADAIRQINASRESVGENAQSVRSDSESAPRRPIRLAFASSAALYGNLGDTMEPLSEETVSDRFLSFYAAQKHASEKLIELYHDFHDIPSLIFRFFNVFGVGQDPTSPYSGVITVFSERARRGDALTLFSAGVQTRDFVPVTDVARALTSALRLPESDWDSAVINLGTGVRTSVRDLAGAIVAITGSSSPIVDGPPREGDVMHSLARIERARSRLNFNPAGNLAKDLVQTLGVGNDVASVGAEGGVGANGAGAVELDASANDAIVSNSNSSGAFEQNASGAW